MNAIRKQEAQLRARHKRIPAIKVKRETTENREREALEKPET